MAIQSDFQLNSSLPQLAKESFRWLPFTFGGTPNINNLDDTSTINAGVTWSLVYEWFFYFSLPAIYFLTTKKRFNIYLIFSLISIFVFLFYPLTKIKIHLISFMFGFFASYCVDNKELISISKTKKISILVAALLVLALFVSVNYYNYISISLVGLAFIFICCGCNLFGLLENKTSRVLGNCTYSMYLLHGIILFIAFKMFFPKNFAIDILSHWAIIFLLTPIVTIISLITYNLIEKPFMNIKTK